MHVLSDQPIPPDPASKSARAGNFYKCERCSGMFRPSSIVVVAQCKQDPQLAHSEIPPIPERRRRYAKAARAARQDC
eukprot:4337962-Alexandrium_andersonii.AAC.1